MNFWFDTADNPQDEQDIVSHTSETTQYDIDEDIEDQAGDVTILESAQQFGLYTQVDDAHPQPLDTASEIEVAEKARWE